MNSYTVKTKRGFSYTVNLADGDDIEAVIAQIEAEEERDAPPAPAPTPTPAPARSVFESAAPAPQGRGGAGGLSRGQIAAAEAESRNRAVEAEKAKGNDLMGARLGATLAEQDPMLRPEFVQEVRQSFGNIPEEQRLDALRKEAQGTNVRARAAKQILRDLEAERTDAERERIMNPAGFGLARLAAAAPKTAAPAQQGKGGKGRPARVDFVDMEPKEFGVIPMDEERKQAAILDQRAATANLQNREVGNVLEDQAFAQRDINAEEFAKRNPVTASLLSGTMQVRRGISGFFDFATSLAASAAGYESSGSASQSATDADIERTAQSLVPEVGRQSMEDAWKKGEFGAWLGTQVLVNAPQLALSATAALVPGGQGASLAMLGGIATGQKYLETGDRLASAGSGIIEIATEKLPLGALERAYKSLKSLPPVVRGDVIRGVARNLAQVGKNVSGVAAVNAIEEMVAQVGNNAIDKYRLGQDKSLGDGVGQAGVVGAASGASLSAPTLAATVPVSRERAIAWEINNAGQQIDALGQNPGFQANADAMARSALSPDPDLVAPTGNAPRPIKVEEQPTTIMPAEQVAQMAQQRQAAMAARELQEQGDQAGVPAAGPGSSRATPLATEAPAANPGAAPVAAQPTPELAEPVLGVANVPQGGLAQRAAAALQPAEQAPAPAAPTTPEQDQQPKAEEWTPPTFKSRSEALVYATEKRMAGLVPVQKGRAWTLGVDPKSTQGGITEKVAGLEELDPFDPGQRTRDELYVTAFNNGVDYRNSQKPGSGGTKATLDTDPSPIFRAIRGVAKQAFGLDVVSVEGITGGDGLAFTVKGKPVAFVRKGAKPEEMTLAVAGHEATHSLFRTRPDLAAKYQSQLEGLLREGVVENRRRYEEQDNTPEGRAYAMEEVAADVSGSMWLREDFWRKVAELDPDLFRGLRYRFMANMAKMLDALGASKVFAKAKSEGGKDRFNLERLVTDVAAARDITAQLWAEKAMGKKLTKAEQKIDAQIDSALGKLKAEGGRASRDEPYGKAPNTLMGYPKSKPAKAFGQSKYRHVEYVRVSWPDGKSMVEAMDGLNKPHALERARRNWSDAEIEAITAEQAEAEDPGIVEAVESSRYKPDDARYSRDDAAPRGPGINFEVAPDPNDTGLKSRWEKAPMDKRLEVSRKVAGVIAPQVLSIIGTRGRISTQVGSYLDDTNPSFSLRLDRPGRAVDVAKALGYALSQDSMVAIGLQPFTGAEKTGAVAVEVGSKSVEQIADIYATLRAIRVGGEQIVSGQSTVDGSMIVLNYSNVGQQEFARAIDAALGGAYTTYTQEVYTAFPGKKDYDYGSQANAARDGGATFRGRIDSVRRQSSKLLDQELAKLRLSRDDGAAGVREGGREVLAGQDGTPEQAAAGARQEEGLRPLKGYPTTPAHQGPDARIVKVAQDYAKQAGIKLRRQGEYVKADPERGKRIADAYAAMPHAPTDPKVRAAYQDLIAQTTAQYRALEKAGYKFWLYDGDTDPYATNPWNAMRDLRATQSMGVFSTVAGFGSDATFDAADNPLLADTGIQWPFGKPDGELRPVLANDLFRAVHDAFGHGIEGVGFRADGEENAWQAHARLFTGSALGALTSETRGQNSWLNFGPYGEKNRTAGLFDTVFADQKTGLMPEWTWTEGIRYSKDKDDWNPVFYGDIEKIDMDAADLEIKDKDALNDELDDALGQRRTARPGSMTMEASPSSVRAAGLMMESVYPQIEYREDGSGKVARVMADGREYVFRVSPFGFDGAWTAIPDQPAGEFGEALRLNNVSEEMAEAYNQRAAASIAIHSEGYDLLRQVDRKQQARLTKTWKALAKNPEAFEFKSEIPAAAFKPGRFTGAAFLDRVQTIADSMLEGSKYQFDIEAQGHMIGLRLRDDPNQEAAIELDEDGRKPRIILHAIALNRGSGAGKAFYQVAAQVAKEYGVDIVADPQGLTAVNTYRRTEQMLSAALRSGDASVVQPGYGQRIYGWEQGKSKAAKDNNLLRIALANARNAKEAVPFADRLRYNLETGEFTADGASAEEVVANVLRKPDVRAMSISRSTLARAAITFEALEGEVAIPDNIGKPVLYSRDEETYTPLEALASDDYKAAEGREIELDDGSSTVRLDAAVLLRDLRDRMEQARQLMDCLA